MVDLDEDATLTGNFESDYLAQCKRMDVKPMALRRFGFPLPPLPLPQAPAPERYAVQREADEGPGRAGDVGGAGGLDVDGGIDDAASRPSLSFYGSTDLLALDRQEDIHRSQRPYVSAYKYTPTINLQADESEDVYKVGVQGYRLPPGTIDIFTSCCSACVSVSELCLSNCGLEEAQIAALCQLIAGSNVRSLCLDRNPLPQESDHLWAQLLAEDSLLKALSLRGNRISDSGATHLGNALKANKSLTMLNLWDNKFGRDGADSLAEGLKSNQTLVSLSLGRNYVGDEGAMKFATAVSKYALEHDEIIARRKAAVEPDKKRETVEEDSASKKPKGRGKDESRVNIRSAKKDETLGGTKGKDASAVGGAGTDSGACAIGSVSVPGSSTGLAAKPAKKGAKDTKGATGKKDKDSDSATADSPAVGTAAKGVKGAKTAKSGEKGAGIGKEAASEKTTGSATAGVPEKEKAGAGVKAAAGGKADKKGGAVVAAGKAGKKGKADDAKDEEVEEVEPPPAPAEPMFESNGQWFVWGNRVLANLNLSYTGCSEAVLKAFYDAVKEQDISSEQLNDGNVGLCRINFRGNKFGMDNQVLHGIYAITDKRNPYRNLQIGGLARPDAPFPGTAQQPQAGRENFRVSAVADIEEEGSEVAVAGKE